MALNKGILARGKYINKKEAAGRLIRGLAADFCF